MKYAAEDGHLQDRYQSYISRPSRSLCPLKCVWCILGPVYVLLFSQRGLHTDIMADRRCFWASSGSPYRVNQSRGYIIKGDRHLKSQFAKPCEFRLEKYQKCHRCFRFYLPLQINASTGIINVHLVAGIRFIPTSFSILGYTSISKTVGNHFTAE